MVGQPNPYGEKIYGVLKQNIPEDKFSLSEEDFLAKMQTEDEYRNKIFNVLNQNVPKESFNLDYENFSGKFLEQKKKDISSPESGKFYDQASKEAQEAISSNPEELDKGTKSSFLDLFDVGKNLGSKEEVIPSFGGMVGASQATETFDKTAAETQIMKSIEVGLEMGAQGQMTYEDVLGDLDDEDFQKIAQIQKNISGIGPIESLEFVSDAKNKFSDDPGKFMHGLVNLGVQSLAMQLRAGYVETLAGIGASVGTGGTATIPAMGLAAGLSSFKVEYMNSVMDYLQQSGVDVTSQEEIANAFNNEEVISGARDFAYKRGVPIAVFDALSGAVGGQILGRVGRGLNPTIAKRATAGVAEMLVQMGLGGGGEYTAQVASGQREAGDLDQLNREIFLEAAGEIIGGAPEVATAGIKEASKRLTQDETKKEDTPKAVQEEETGKTFFEPENREDLYEEIGKDLEEPKAGEVIELPSLHDKGTKFKYTYDGKDWSFTDSKGKTQKENGPKAQKRIQQMREEMAAPKTGRGSQWENNAIESLPESQSTSEELEKTIKEGKWGMLTAENPNAKPATEQENIERNKKAQQWLQDKGYSYTPIVGSYEGKEMSFFVPDLTKEDAIEFSKVFEQDSVATNEGMVKQDGKMNPRTGEVFNTDSDDFYSVLKTKDGPVKFAVNYDFDTTVDSSQPVITPENSSNYANMTEDEDGNFVFYHTGKKGYKQIEPRSGDNKTTSRPEASALSKVGGLAMFYTDKKNKEFAGERTYMTKVPKEKVYDANSDPNNYLEEARKRHEEEHPGKAFDKNTQVAYITKIAAENGFPVTVSRWGKDKTRAQSAQPMEFSDTEDLEGNTITKSFEKEYQSNRGKFTPQDAKTVRSNIRPVLEKIERELSNDFSSPLYNILADPKLGSVEEITQAVNDSDLPQELKDEYNEAVNMEETPSMSVPVETEKTEKGVEQKGPPNEPPKEDKKRKSPENPLTKRYPRSKLEQSNFISDEAKEALDNYDDGGYDSINVKPLHRLANDLVHALTMDELKQIIPALKRGEGALENAIVADEFALVGAMRAYMEGNLKLFAELQSIYEQGVSRDLNSTQTAQRLASRGQSETARLMDIINNLTRDDKVNREDSKGISDSINSDVEEILSENKEMKGIIEDLQKKVAKAMKGTKPEEKLGKKGYEKIAEKIRQQKIDPDELAFSAVIPPSLINAAIEIIAKTIEAAGSLAEGVSKAMSMLRHSEWGASMTEEEKRRFEKTIPSKLEKLASRVLSKKESNAVQTSSKLLNTALEDLGIEFADVVDKHYKEREGTYNTLKEKLIEELGLPPNLAEEKANQVIQSFRDKVERAINREMDRFIAKQKDEVQKNVEEKKVKAAKNQMLRVFESGRVMSDQEVQKAFKKALGGHDISIEEMQFLNELTYTISQMPEGLRKTRKVIEFNNRISDLEGISTLFTLRAWYYASMLSGVFTTTLRATFGFLQSTTVQNIASFFANPRAYISTLPYFFQGMSVGNMGDVLLTGYTDLDYFGRDVTRIKESQDLLNRNVNEMVRRVAAAFGKDIGIAKKDMTLAGQAFAIAFGIPVVMASRAILLIDALMTPGQAEHEAAMLAFHEAKSSNKKIMDSVQERLNYNKNEEYSQIVEQEMEQMKEDGESILGYKKRRMAQLRQQERSGNIMDIAMERAKTAALLNTPYGLIGSGVAVTQNWINTPSKSLSIGALKTFLLTTFPFLRVAANFTINNIEYLPGIGILPSIGKKRLQLMENGKVELVEKPPMERRRQFTKQIIGSTVATALVTSLFDWDEEEDELKAIDNPWLDITYRGPGTFDSSDWISEELAEKEYESLTYRVKLPNGKYSRRFSYREMPGLGNILAGLGYMKDYHKYVRPEKIKEDGYGISDWVSKFAYHMNEFSTEQSFAQGINSIRKLGEYVAPGGDEEREKRAAIKEMEKVISRPINTIVGPNFYRQAYRMEKVFFEKPKDKSMGDVNYYTPDFWKNAVGRMVKDIPLAEQIYQSHFNQEVKTDHFGRPVVTPVDIPYLFDRGTEWEIYNYWRRRDYPERELLYSFDKVTLGWPWSETSKEYGGIKLDDGMKNEIEKKQKIIFRNFVNDNIDDLYDIGEQDQFLLQDRLDKYSRIAGRKARGEWYNEVQDN